MKPEQNQKPMNWQQFLVMANLRGEGGERNLYHFLPEGVSLKDEVTQDFPEAFKLASIYREIEPLQAEIRTKYPNRCLSCNGRGGELIFEDGYDYPFFCHCSGCVCQGLDPCDISLKLLPSPWGDISPTRNQEIYTRSDYVMTDFSSSWYKWDKLSYLRAKAERLRTSAELTIELLF